MLPCTLSLSFVDRVDLVEGAQLRSAQSISPDYVIVWVYSHVRIDLHVAKPNLKKTASL